MAWPMPVDFRDAVQNPHRCFEVVDLAQGTTAVTRMGTPLVYSGNFACVFKVATGSGDVAVRCFTREVKDQQERYGYLSEYLRGVRPESFVGFEYVERGIRVNGEWYPIVRMDWAEGDRLDKFIGDHIDRPDIFVDLAARWRGVMATLRGLGIAHNDLQHGNVMVLEQGALRLVDYDGIFLPRFEGTASPEVGHRHYQHPKRSSQDYHAGIDNFPSLVVYLTLLAMSADPQLWDRFYNQENMLFTRDDFANPASSGCFRALKGSPDTNVSGLAGMLEEFCARPVAQVPDLESVLLGAPPAPSPIPPPPANPTMERSCPRCNSRDAQLRRDWHERSNALRCRNCKGVFGKTMIKRCPNCGSQEARLRRDWDSRGRPFRCIKCNKVFGGTDQTPPTQPAVGRTPNLVRYLAEATVGGVDAEQITDRARGVMLGVVVGNLLGLPIEGRSRRRIEEEYPKGVTEIIPAEMTRPMDDDPAQSVELAEALLQDGDLSKRFADRLITWSIVNGRGMGSTTRQSINQLKDGVPPPVAAYAVYRAKGENAPNGGIMRCTPVAVSRRRDPERLIQDTADTCAVSHYAPESQWSCVIVNAAVAILLSGGILDLSKLLTAARADGCPDLAAVTGATGVPTRFLENAARGRPSPRDTSWMRGNRGPNGHTVLTMQAGLWAATTPLDFEEALVALVSSGGDSDTNGALAGAVLGARYGASAIPLRWSSYVSQKERLVDLADRLASM